MLAPSAPDGDTFVDKHHQTRKGLIYSQSRPFGCNPRRNPAVSSTSLNAMGQANAADPFFEAIWTDSASEASGALRMRAG